MCLSVVVFCKLIGLCFPFRSVSVFPSYFVDNCYSICICTQPSSLMSLYQSSLLQQKRSFMQIYIWTLINKAAAGQHWSLFICLLLQESHTLQGTQWLRLLTNSHCLCPANNSLTWKGNLGAFRVLLSSLAGKVFRFLKKHSFLCHPVRPQLTANLFCTTAKHKLHMWVLQLLERLGNFLY